MKRDVYCSVIAGILSICICGQFGFAGQGAGASPVSVSAQAGGGCDRIVDFFEVHDADVRSVFRQLSSYSGVDIVVDDNVKGSVSITVTNKSWREILGIVCKLGNLAAIQEDSYIYILSQEDFAKRKTSDATSVQLTQDTSPLHREIIKIQHAPAADIKDAVQGMLSPRGKLMVVSFTNSLIVFDTQDNINAIKDVIDKLDIETAQISISCKIIEVSSGVGQQLGIHWGYFNNTDNVSASHLPVNNMFTGALETMSYGILSPRSFSMTLEYLFTDNKGEVVAQPQITTLDNKEAHIFMGDQVPVTYKDVSGNTVVQMVNAGTELSVTPHISGEGRIMMSLAPKKESYAFAQNGEPVISEQSASTNVVVSNGETVVIAGLTSNESTKTDNGIPVLKDIPLIGNLFKLSNKQVDKKDLIIFVTPNIIERKVDPVQAPARQGAASAVQGK